MRINTEKRSSKDGSRALYGEVISLHLGTILQAAIRSDAIRKTPKFVTIVSSLSGYHVFLKIPFGGFGKC